MKIEDVAAVCHEANKMLCLTQGDSTQSEWMEAPEWQKQSAINGVKFHMENPHATPEQSHENWLKEKLADGWKYGTVKDPAKKEHPCFRAYSELPVEQRTKDYLFKSIVDGLRQFVV